VNGTRRFGFCRAVKAGAMLFFAVFFLGGRALIGAAPGAPAVDEHPGDAVPDDAGASSRHNPRNEFALWGGISPAATAVFGGLRPEETEDRQFYVVALRYGRLLGSWSAVDLHYVADVIPAAVAANTIVSRQYPPGDARSRGNVWGFGLSPLGVRTTFRPGHRWRPYVAANAGFLHFREPVPLPQSAQFNFTFEIDGGLILAGHPRRTWFGGVKFHHLSNGGRSATNRGMNSIQFFFGVSFWR